jgi:hypothetical protein
MDAPDTRGSHRRAEEFVISESGVLTNNDCVDFSRQRHSMSHWRPLEDSDIFSKSFRLKKKGSDTKANTGGIAFPLVSHWFPRAHPIGRAEQYREHPAST